MILDKNFLSAVRSFDKIEKRGSFYEMALNLIEKGFETEAHLLLLATWNFAAFRYAVTSFDIECYRATLKKLKPCFNRLKGKSIRKIDYDKHGRDIKNIFSTLSSIGGVGSTGASKIMSLSCPRVFVMWDGYIRGEKTKKLYNQIPAVIKGDIEIRKYGRNHADYLKFLKDMQATFGHIKYRDTKQKTFAKAIDEFNYVTITLPIQRMEKGKKA